MAKWLIPSVICAVGVCVSCAGLSYGVFTVGVPTPDAPPSVAAREARDAGWAGLGMAGGLGILAAGLMGLAVVGLRHASRRQTGA